MFGEVYWRDLPPGLHYLAPRPLVQVDKWPVREVKSIMCDTPQDYVSGDLNLISLTVNVPIPGQGPVQTTITGRRIQKRSSRTSFKPISVPSYPPGT